MKVYLAGPMSGYAEHNFPAFDAAAADLRSRGFEVISPADLSREIGVQGKDDGTIDHQAYATCMRQDIEALLQVQGVVCLPGWQKSRGAKFEVHLAQLLGLTVAQYPECLAIREIVCTDCREPHEVMARAMNVLEGKSPDGFDTIRSGSGGPSY